MLIRGQTVRTELKMGVELSTKRNVNTGPCAWCLAASFVFVCTQGFKLKPELSELTKMDVKASSLPQTN